MASTEPIPEGKLTTGEMIGLYGKALAGAVVTGLGAYITAREDGATSTGEWIAIVASFLGALAIIWAIPQTPPVLAKYGKAVFAGLAAAAASLITGFTDGSLSQAEIITAVIALIISSGLTGSVSDAASSDPVDANGHRVGVPADVKQAMLTGPTHTRRVGPRVVLDAGPTTPYAAGGTIPPPVA